MLRKYLYALIDIFFPPLCRHCGTKTLPDTYLCSKCLKALEGPPLHSRLRRGGPAWSALAFNGPVKSLIHQFKYSHHRYLAEPLAAIMAKKLESVFPRDYDVITFVPAHPARFKERGYSPAGLLAFALAKHFKIPCVDDIIYASRCRPSQTTLDKPARAKNISGVFKVKRNIDGKKIAVIDDTLTTGSTIDECCRILKTGGAGAVAAFTLAKVRYEDIT